MDLDSEGQACEETVLVHGLQPVCDNDPDQLVISCTVYGRVTGEYSLLIIPNSLNVSMSTHCQ